MSCEKEARPTHSKNIPTEVEVIRRALRSPRMAALFFPHFEAPPSSIMIQTLSIDEKTNIRYIFPPLENELELTEIDFLFQKGFLNTRTKNALRRAGITQICQLPQVIDGSLGVRGISKKYREDLSNCLKQFVQMVIQKQEESPGKIVILETPTLPIPKKQVVPENWIPVVNFVRTWQDEHPGRKGSLTAATTHFQITKQRISQIVTGYEQITGESLKPEKATSLSDLARELGTKFSILLKLLRQGKISFGKKIDPLYTAPEPPSRVISRLKLIPISSVNKDKLKRQLPEYLSVANVMEHLTKNIAKRNKDTFFPLSKLARQANMGNLRQLSEIFDELTAAGFHLKKLPGRGGNNFYYYAHGEEAEAIVSYLKEKHRAENPIRLIFGPANVPIPTTTEFGKQFVSVLNIVQEVMGLRVHPGLLRGVLNIIFQENTLVPVYVYYLPRHQSIRIPQDYLEVFKVQVLAKKEEIIAFLEAHRHKS